MFLRVRTAQARSRETRPSSEPARCISPSVIVVLANLRMVIVGPSRAIGGITTFTRCPPGKRASTMGELSSTRRPSGAKMRSISARTCASSVNTAVSRSNRPDRSMNNDDVPFTMTSVIVGSSTSDCNGPMPNTISSKSRESRAFNSFDLPAHRGEANACLHALCNSLRARRGFSSASRASTSPGIMRPTSSFNSSSIHPSSRARIAVPSASARRTREESVIALPFYRKGAHAYFLMKEIEIRVLPAHLKEFSQEALRSHL